MKNIKKQLNLYLPFAKAGMKVELAYKAQIVMWIAISFFEILFVLFLYHAVYRNSEGGINSIINGFSFYDMVLYMITSFFFSFVMGAGDTAYDIYTDIKEGTIANTLTKPVSYRLRHMFNYLGVLVFDFSVVIIPFFTLVYGIFLGFGILQVSAAKFLTNLAFFLIFSAVAGLLNNAISYFVGMLIFYTDHLFGLNMVRNALQGFLGGQMIPLAYMGTLGVVFSYMPFAFMNSVPVLTIMCKLDVKNILVYLLIALLWLGLIETVNHLIFKHAIKKITVQGG
ncbi:MAG: ABC transporter permease [Eubacteriales bacterium]